MISMAEIERETRKSEQEIRKLKMAEMMSETHEKKVIRSSAIVQEFEDVLGRETVYVSTSGGEKIRDASHD